MHARSPSMASARSTPRLPIGARRARAARARGARQVHLRHEGEGAPRVARPVQALGDPVRPAPAAAAAVRVGGGAGAALLRMALPRRALGWHHAALDAAAAALPVVGRGRATRAHGWRPRPDRRAVRGEAGASRRGRTVGAQVRVQLRARGAAGGGRLAESQDTVSAADRRAPTARPSTHAWRACARTRRARLGPCACAYVSMQQCVYVHANVCAHAQHASQRGRACVGARGASWLSFRTYISMYISIYL